MDKKILISSENLMKEIDKIERFENKYGEFPVNEAKRIITGLKKTSEMIQSVDKPENWDELIKSELKRRLQGEVFSLEQRITPTFYEANKIIKLYNIPEEDLTNLYPWLIKNRNTVQKTIEKLFQTKNLTEFENYLPTDILEVRNQVERVASNEVQKYHREIGKLFKQLTDTGSFLENIKASTTMKERSFFNEITNSVAISIPLIYYLGLDNKIKLKERDLIRVYGHESMGHALNYTITKNSDLPYFLTKGNSSIVTATQESIAMFYEKIIFEELKKSPETQKKLGIFDRFESIYQEEKDLNLIEEYRIKLYQFGILTLANKELGEPLDPKTLRRKEEVLNEVAINPANVRNFIERNRYNFDSEGNLGFQLVSELRYCAQPVQKALEEFSKQGILYDRKSRSLIDSTFLKGFWTPEGFVDNARIKAQNYKLQKEK